MATVETSTHLGFRDRWLTAGLLGIGLITFAINGSTTNLILSKLMTSLRVELYHIHWVITAFGIAHTVTIPALGWLSGRLGLRRLRSVANTLGPATAAVLWNQRFAYHLQHYAESSPVDSFGFIAALGQLRNTLVLANSARGDTPLTNRWHIRPE